MPSMTSLTLCASSKVGQVRTLDSHTFHMLGVQDCQLAVLRFVDIFGLPEQSYSQIQQSWDQKQGFWTLFPVLIVSRSLGRGSATRRTKYCPTDLCTRMGVHECDGKTILSKLVNLGLISIIFSGFTTYLIESMGLVYGWYGLFFLKCVYTHTDVHMYSFSGI